MYDMGAAHPEAPRGRQHVALGQPPRRDDIRAEGTSALYDMYHHYVIVFIITICIIIRIIIISIIIISSSSSSSSICIIMFIVFVILGTTACTPELSERPWN